MIYAKEHHLQIIRDILKKYPYTFYAYGSRVKGTHRILSDLDICFMEAIPFNVQAHLDEEFEESDVPFIVQVVDFHLMSPEFQQLIQNDLVLISEHQIQTC